jgi:hypothetical protein
MEVSVRWNASDSLLREELVREGVGNPQKRCFSLDVGTMTPVERQAVLALAGMSLSYKGVACLGDVDLSQRYAVLPEKDYLGHWYAREDVKLDHQPEVGEVLRLGAELKAAQEAALALQEAKEAESARAAQELGAALKREYAAIDALEKAGDVAGLEAYRPTVVVPDNALYNFWRARDDAVKGLKARAAVAEKACWIAAHGSAHLKRAVAEGYDCQRLYVLERAAIEAAEFIVDFYNGAEWRERSCPTVAALDACDAARKLVPAYAGMGEPMVVWLTSPARVTKIEDEYGDFEEPFEPCEAAVLRDYLGKYDLVKII